MATFKVKNLKTAEQYCIKNVGPRRYWIHNKIGGTGWDIQRNYNDSAINLTIEDDKKALLAMLALSNR